MKDALLKIACFLTGHNYKLVKHSSESSTKTVKKYFSALLIIILVWAFIGFSFTQRYLHGDVLASLTGAVVMIFLIIQIERQIILTRSPTILAKAFRIVIGVIMAIIGSFILDQIMFKDDIEKHKAENIQIWVKEASKVKREDLDIQIGNLNKSIDTKEGEKNTILNEVTLKPTISTPSSSINYSKDSLSGKMVESGRTIVNTSLPNPKMELIPLIDKQISDLRVAKLEKENEILNIQKLTEVELLGKVGFLDELKMMYDILLSSSIGLFVWILFFLFFATIELFVLVNKITDKENDYDKLIDHQMAVRLEMLEKLKKGLTLK